MAPENNVFQKLEIDNKYSLQENVLKKHFYSQSIFVFLPAFWTIYKRSLAAKNIIWNTVSAQIEQRRSINCLE